MRQLRCVNFCKNFPAAHLWANQGLTFACLATQRLEKRRNANFLAMPKEKKLQHCNIRIDNRAANTK